MARRRHPDPDSAESGAAIVEIALIAPVLFLLVFGLLEFAVVFRDQLTTQDAVGDSVRMGAIVGPAATSGGGNADYEMMRALREGLGSIPREWVTGVVVFKGNPASAGPAANQVPAACKNGFAVPGRCNVYPPQQMFQALDPGGVGASYFTCPGGPACSWPPSSRDDGPNPTEIDYVGVWVRVQRQAFTGFFRPTFTFERAAVLRLEPGAT